MRARHDIAGWSLRHVPGRHAVLEYAGHLYLFVVRSVFQPLEHLEMSIVCKAMTAPVAERIICGAAAEPLPAHHRRTCRTYVLVGSYAVSVPRKVPRRWAGNDQSRRSVCVDLLNAADLLPGAVPSPLAGACGGMHAATEPAWMDPRRVRRAVRAPRPRPTPLRTTWMTLRMAKQSLRGRSRRSINCTTFFPDIDHHLQEPGSCPLRS